MSGNKNNSFKNWGRDVHCTQCGYDNPISFDDLYTETDDGHLKICITCSSCGNVIHVKVPDSIKEAVIHAP